MLRGYQIELGYGKDHIRLPLSMDGRPLPKMHAYIYDPVKKVRDLSLVDLAWVLAAGSNSYKIGRYSPRSARQHSPVQDITTLVAHAQLVPT